MFDESFLPIGAVQLLIPAVALVLLAACCVAWRRRNSLAVALLGVSAFLTFLQTMAIHALAWLFDVQSPGWQSTKLLSAFAACLGLAGALLLARDLARAREEEADTFGRDSDPALVRGDRKR
jgi:hypothetical protein